MTVQPNLPDMLSRQLMFKRIKLHCFFSNYGKALFTEGTLSINSNRNLNFVLTIFINLFYTWVVILKFCAFYWSDLSLFRITSQPCLDPPISKWHNGQSRLLNQTFITAECVRSKRLSTDKCQVFSVFCIACYTTMLHEYTSRVVRVLLSCCSSIQVIGSTIASLDRHTLLKLDIKFATAFFIYQFPLGEESLTRFWNTAVSRNLTWWQRDTLVLLNHTHFSLGSVTLSSNIYIYVKEPQAILNRDNLSHNRANVWNQQNTCYEHPTGWACSRCFPSTLTGNNRKRDCLMFISRRYSLKLILRHVNTPPA